MRKNFLKKTIAWMLCTVLICALVPAASAAPRALPEEEIVQPMYNYVSNYSTTLSISGGTATCKASITGYTGTTTKVAIEMTLQKKSGLFSWDDVETWKSSINTYTLTSTKTKSVGSGTYRVKVKFTAYSGTASESFTKNSSTKTY